MATLEVPRHAAPHAPASALDAAYSRITWRIIPFIFALWVLAWVDRVNVGFVKLTMLDELGWSEAVYGLGAGIFFLGYFFFEVPSNLVLERIGARIWMARIMVTWGMISSATLFVRSSSDFCAMRFLLGVAEAGFFPGMILYLSYWFPTAQRARGGRRRRCSSRSGRRDRRARSASPRSTRCSS